MMVVHMNMVTRVTLGKLNHHYLGWVEDAQGFVFISGLVVGLVYGGMMIRKSADRMVKALRARMVTIYTYHAFLIIGFATLALALNAIGYNASVLQPYTEHPMIFSLLSLGLVTGSMHMGILPMYLWFMLATPLVLRAFHAGHAPTVLVVSLGLWLFAQTGLVDYWVHAIESDTGMPLGIFFNIFGWQVIFFSGLWFGYLLAADRLDLGVLRHPSIKVAAVPVLLLVLLLAVYDRIVFDDLVSHDFSMTALLLSDRGNFTPIYLLSFFLDLFLIAWLIVAGRDCGIRIVERLSALVSWIFTRPALIFLGQHSLQVFAWHLVMVYLADILLGGHRVGEVAGSLILIAGVASLYIPAAIHARPELISAMTFPRRRT